MKAISFSLVELLVTIAIVGLLAAIAVPTYKEYKIRARISAIMSSTERTINDIKLSFDKNGVFPNSIMFNGFLVDSLGRDWGASPPINLGDIYNVKYFISSDALGASFEIQLGNFSVMPGWVNPATTGDSPIHSIVRTTMRYINGSLVTVCGFYGGYPSQEIDAAYLPPNCTCTNTSSFMRTGTGC